MLGATTTFARPASGPCSPNARRGRQLTSRLDRCRRGGASDFRRTRSPHRRRRSSEEDEQQQQPESELQRKRLRKAAGDVRVAVDVALVAVVVALVAVVPPIAVPVAAQSASAAMTMYRARGIVRHARSMCAR